MGVSSIIGAVSSEDGLRDRWVSRLDDPHSNVRDLLPDFQLLPFVHQPEETYIRKRIVPPTVRGSLGVPTIRPELPAWIVRFWM